MVSNIKKKYIVKKNYHINQIMLKKDSVANKSFIVYKKQNNIGHFRVVISVGKKYGIAVERNKIKRQIRALVHKYLNNIDQSYDFLIIIRTNIKSLSFLEIEKNLIDILIKAKLVKREVLK